MINNNTPVLHRKEWQMMTPPPVVNATGAFVANSNAGISNTALFMASGTVHYLYHHDEDAWVQIPSGAIAGTFIAGACGDFHPWSINYTANGGSTTTVTVAVSTHNLNGYVRGKMIRFLTGTAANIGQERTITEIKTIGTAGTNVTLTLSSALPAPVANNDTFKVNSGRFFVLGTGTLAAGSFKSFDVGTLAWQASHSITNLPATWATNGIMIVPYSRVMQFATGTATSGSATTLVNSGKAWTIGQWINYQVRITAGTGIGQVSKITDSNATTLTFASGATIDSTSQYVIEGDEDAIYVLGNAAVTMYKYSISGNNWAVMAPTTARAAAPAVGMSGNWIGETGDVGWADENNVLDGQFIYSLRGTSTLIDRFKISGGTAGAGAWEQVNYIATETFGVGSSATVIGKYIIVKKDATNRFFKFNVRGNYFEPLNTNLYTDGAALSGGKIWTYDFDGTGAVTWVYSMTNTSAVLHRMMLI